MIPVKSNNTRGELHRFNNYETLDAFAKKLIDQGYKNYQNYSIIEDQIESLNESLSDEIQAKISDLKAIVKQMIDESWFEVLSFDNLALEQLGIKEILPQETWEQFYMGDDGRDGAFEVPESYGLSYVARPSSFRPAGR